jgi:hypothetical protein
MEVPVWNPALISLDFPLETLISILNSKIEILRCDKLPPLTGKWFIFQIPLYKIEFLLENGSYSEIEISGCDKLPPLKGISLEIWGS